MAKGLEIERKFLVRSPDIGSLAVKRKAEIVQTYLENGGNGSQRRVRCITENGITSYTYTEKVFLTPITREENEYAISGTEYLRLLGEARKDRRPVVKTRYCFEYLQQSFELDVYPFSRELAILELELDSPEQEILFPDTLKVIREVSSDERYSNAELANAGAFPDWKNGDR